MADGPFDESARNEESADADSSRSVATDGDPPRSDATPTASEEPASSSSTGPGSPSSEGPSAPSGGADRPHLSNVRRQPAPYTESQVIMSTVKVVAPIVFTYGLFVTFHGAGSPGGGFQGGAIMAAVVFMIAFAFGIDATRDWLRNSVIVGLAAAGVVIFGGTGVLTVALGGRFLEYALLPIPDAVKWGMELVEIGGVAFIVGGVLIGLFFALAAGFTTFGTEGER